MSGFQLQGNAAELYEQFVAPIMAPFVDAALDAAGLGDGAAVLDVACGTGFVARRAADQVGATGRVAGVDVNPAMLALARAASSPAKIEWQQAPAHHLPFDHETFDRVICQQGLQFFPDPAVALSEMRRVTRPAGRIVATVWSPLDHSPYMVAQYEALRSVLGDEAVASFLGAFSFGDRLHPMFTAAGLSDVTVHEVLADVVVPDPRTFLAGHLLALPWGAAVAQQHHGIERAVEVMGGHLVADLHDDGSLQARFASVLARGER